MMHRPPRLSQIPQPDIEPIPDSGGLYRYHSEFRIRLPLSGAMLIISPAFRTDGASIPQIVWGLFGITPFDADFIAPCVGAHDQLYAAELLPRADCDAELRALMRLNGDRAATWANRFHLAVRLGGWRVWRQHTEQTVYVNRLMCRLE
jgi:hypothetical protein